MSVTAEQRTTIRARRDAFARLEDENRKLIERCDVLQGQLEETKAELQRARVRMSNIRRSRDFYKQRADELRDALRDADDMVARGA